MAVYKSKTPTKDGRQYFFRIKYKDIFGVSHDYSSPKYATKKEATTEEALYLIKINNKQMTTSNITLEQAFLDYYNQKTRQVKKQTLKKDMNLWKYLEPIKNIKINSLDLTLYRKWRNYVDTLPYSTETIKKIVQLFKRLIEYSAKYYNTSDTILKFVDGVRAINEQKKEMDFFTYDEYLKYLSKYVKITLKYFDIHFTVKNDCKEGYSVFIAMPANSSEDEAIQEMINQHLYEEPEDLDNIDYVGEISEKEYREAKGIH